MSNAAPSSLSMRSRSKALPRVKATVTPFCSAVRRASVSAGSLESTAVTDAAALPTVTAFCAARKPVIMPVIAPPAFGKAASAVV